MRRARVGGARRARSDAPPPEQARRRGRCWQRPPNACSATRLQRAPEVLRLHHRLAAPIGILGDLLASALNANVGARALSPAATEVEAQTIRLIAHLIGFEPSCGGLMVSGGNMANLVCFWVKRGAAGWDVRRRDRRGLASAARLRIRDAHLDPEAADLRPGTASIRWIPVDGERMDVDALRRAIEADVAAGDRPLLVVGTAGTVSTGAVDPLPAIAAVCREHGVWFHVDGAYGGFAAAAPDAPADLAGIGLADSIAVDPHKWLYAPLEACAVRDASICAPRSPTIRRTTTSRARHELRRLRPAELARLSRAQGGWRCARSAPAAIAR